MKARLLQFAILLLAFTVSLSSQTIPVDFFGNHMDVGPTSGATTILAPMIVGAHGKAAVTDWEYLETSRGVYNWSALDSAVSRARAKGVTIFEGHEYVARFATSNTATCNVNGLGPNQCTAAPDDLHVSAACQGLLTGTTTTDCKWKEFLTSLVQRYKSTGIQTGCTSSNPQCHGTIQMYEGWNEPPYPTPMSITDFVAFETDFLNTIRANDPNAKVGSPAFIIAPVHPSYATFMSDFFANGGPTSYDSYDFHINGAQPEDQIALINQFKSILTTAGVSNPVIYSTEAGRGWDCNESLPSNAVQQAYVGRIEPIYWANGIKRHYWYAYCICGPLSNQPTSNSLTPLGIAYGNVANWMLGSTMGTLTMSSVDPNNSRFTATLTKNGTTNIIAWHSGAGASYTPPSGYTSYKDLNGNTTAITGGSVNLTNAPILLLSTPPPTTPAKWITGFWSAGNGRESIANIPWSNISHLCYFAAGINSSGSVVAAYTSQPELANIVTAAHAHGVKIVIVLSDGTGNHFEPAASSGTVTTTASNIAAYVAANNFDGVDFDWESSVNIADFESLISHTRSALPAGKIITADVFNAGSNHEAVMANQYSNLDQINAMCYDMDTGYGYTWHNDALLQNGDTSKSTCDWRVRAFTNAGVPAAKMGVGMPFYGRHWTGTSLPLQSGGTVGSTPFYADLVNGGLITPTNLKWDATYSVDYLSLTGTNEFYSFNGVRFIDTMVPWAKSKGYGGFMAFTLEYEYISSQSGNARYPLSTELNLQVVGGSTSAPTISSFTVSPTSIFPGSSSTISWSTSGATSLSISPGVGTVTGTSTVVSPTVTTTYTLSATNSGGTVTRQITLVVSAPTISSFTATPSSIFSGNSSTLSWSTSGSTSLSINQSVGSVTGTTSKVVNPTVNTVYTLTATNSAGSATRSVTVTMSSTASVNTFFVSSSSGSDSNNGTSATTPWQTVSKVNNRTYLPGDVISFKSGDTWSGTMLTTPSSGNASSPITYNSYGTGTMPILNAGGSLDPAMRITKNYITVTGLWFKNARSPTGCLLNYSGASNVKILNNRFTDTAWSAIISETTANTTALINGNTCDATAGHVQLRGCVLVQGPGKTTVTHNVADWRNINTVSSGANVIGFEVDGSTSQSVIDYNTVYGGAQGVTMKPGSGVYLNAVNGGSISDNYLWHIMRLGDSAHSPDGQSCIGSVQGDGEAIELEGHAAPYPQTNVIVARNIIIGTVGTSGQTGDHSCSNDTSDAIGTYYASDFIFGNIMIGPVGTYNFIHWGARDSASSAPNLVYNNTFYQDVTLSRKTGRAVNNQGSSGSGFGQYLNNIIVGLPTGYCCGDSGTSSEDYTLFYNVASQSTGVAIGSHSSSANPLFVDSTPTNELGLKLQVSSPAIGTGLNLSSPYNITFDSASGAFPYSHTTNVSPADKGAWIYGGSGGGGTTPPSIQLFTANPSSIVVGNFSILSWTTSDATTVSIDHSIGIVAQDGSLSVSPPGTTTYRMTATNSVATVTSDVTLGVTFPLAEINRFSAYPRTINSGDPSTLSWVTSNDTSRSINQSVGSVTGLSSVVVNPTVDTTYQMTASNTRNTVSAFTSISITVQVYTPATAAPSVHVVM